MANYLTDLNQQEGLPMGETTKFRSEEARKNYEKNEKQRARAMKRKAAQSKQTEMKGYAKAWLEQHPMKSLLAAAAVVALIAVVVLAGRALTDPLKGKQDNWLILDTAASGNPRYEHLADFDIPAGFTRDEYSLYKDGVQQDFFCVAEDAANPVQDVYVTGAKGIDAADYPQVILNYGLHKEAGEPRQLTIAGQDCSALYLVSDESEWSGEGMAIAHMSFYFPTNTNACITVTLRSGTMPFEQLPDEATLLKEAEKLLSGLKLVK